jgi:hypothetical protein
MQSFRRHQSFIWLALFALSAQLVLTFGHVHLHATQNHQTDVATTGTCGPDAQSPCPKQSDDDESHCPICQVISIAGTLVLPAPPAIDLRPQEPVSVEPPRSVGSLCGEETVQFQARAPPLA